MITSAPNLSHLARRIAVARIDVADDRRHLPGHRHGHRHGPDTSSRRLLVCLEAYASALAANDLPIPPPLRDELRLRRGL